MKCAVEVLKIKKAADAERVEQERIRKFQVLETAKAATLIYAEEIVSELCNRAREGKSLSITRHFDPNADGLYRQMYKGSAYSNGREPYRTYREDQRPALNMDYLKETLADLCYTISERSCWLHINSTSSTHPYREITFSVPSSLPCD